MNHTPADYFKLGYVDKPWHCAAGWSRGWPGTPHLPYGLLLHSTISEGCSQARFIGGRDRVLPVVISAQACISDFFSFFFLFFSACWSLEETSCFLIIGIRATHMLFSVTQCVWLLTLWKWQTLLLASPILFCNFTAWTLLSLENDFFKIVFYTTVFFFPEIIFLLCFSQMQLEHVLESSNQGITQLLSV